MKSFEDVISYKFNNKSLLETALTHSSFVNENRKYASEDYQRLEFLGDSVLGFLTAEYLFSKENITEGIMTRMRSELVSEKALYEVAKAIDLGKYIRIGKGEEHMGGRERPSVLSDIVESVTAAIYLDSGMDAAKDFVMRFVLNDVHMASAEVSDDYKSALQELIQHDPSNILSYELIEEKGPDHSKTFTFAALLNGEVVGTGSGSTKKSAEQAAARNALEKLNDERP
ncbi:MAG: ribonuclease III [Oscillospiraceae bacterium]|jgi:ribonuclease-3|nr:ribonuclease III [Oscillospiraceae bacterium]MBQ2146379.1 ribonuclease III [Oscillospiraceae bacterium]MBQ5490374.1 ribonuclease III [Oscillospiraceae bacterium]